MSTTDTSLDALLGPLPAMPERKWKHVPRMPWPSAGKSNWPALCGYTGKRAVPCAIPVNLRADLCPDCRRLWNQGVR